MKDAGTPLAVAFVRLDDAAMPTGIGTYFRGLRGPLSGLCRLHEVVIAKRELRLGRFGIGGNLSPVVQRELLPIPRGTDLVHASEVRALHPRARVLTIMDLIPLKSGEHPRQRRLFERLRRRIRRLDRLITLTRAVADEAAALFDLPPQRFAPIHLGVDHARFFPDAVRPQAFADAVPNILMGGLYQPRKRFHAVIEAAARIGPCRVLRVGPAPRGELEEPYAARCAALAAASGVELVDLGYVPVETLRHAYSSADVFCFPSEDEGFGLPPLEAMACGTTVVASGIPPHREVMGDAAIYPKDDGPDALAAAIEGALKTPKARDALVRHAQGFTWAKTAHETLAVYRQVAG